MKALIYIIIVFFFLFFIYTFVFAWTKLGKDGSDAEALFTASGILVAILVGLLACYTWYHERILQLDEEYNKLAEARKIFWNTIDQAYGLHTGRLSCGKLVDELIRPDENHSYKNVYQQYFKSRQIKDDPKNDLLAIAKEIKNRICKLNDDDNIKKLWSFAVFMYPYKEDLPAKYYRINSNDRKQFDIARGKLSRFWNKWASKLYSRQYLLHNYKMAHEQLIMLTWLELALVIQIDDLGKGKVALFKLTEKINRKVNNKKITKKNNSKSG